MKKFMLTYWVETHYLSARYYFGSADEDGDEGLMNELAPILRAVRIGRTARAWWLERPRGNVTEGSSLAGAHFTKGYDNLDLEDSWQSWEYLK